MNFFYYKSTNNYPALIFIAIVVAILLVQSAVKNHSEYSKSESIQTNQGPLYFAQARPIFEGFANNNLELKLSQPSNGNQVDVIRKEELLNDYQYLIDSTEEASVIIHDYYGNLLGTIQFDTTSQPLELFCLEGQNRVYLDFTKLRQINL